jgi:hypothetical protein
MDDKVEQLSRARKPAPRGATDARATPPPTSINPPATSMIEVSVGTQGTHVYTRTWHLSRSLLNKHSTAIRRLPEKESKVALASTNPQIFQNYLNYAYSSIYSLNRLIDVSPIRQHTDAWLLGSVLGSPDFCTASLRALYSISEPCARSECSTAARSPIRAEDIEYVCKESVVGSALRNLYFDAVAAHWTRGEAANIEGLDNDDVDIDADAGSDENGKDGTEKKVKWLDLYTAYPDFKSRVFHSLVLSDGKRGVLLRDVDEYASGQKKMGEVSVPYESVGEEVVNKGEGGNAWVVEILC